MQGMMKSSYAMNFSNHLDELGLDITKATSRLALAKMQPAVTSLPGFSELKLDGNLTNNMIK